MQAFTREYVPGEFTGVPLPDGVNLARISHVHVRRLGAGGQARIPLTREEYEASLSSGRAS